MILDEFLSSVNSSQILVSTMLLTIRFLFGMNMKRIIEYWNLDLGRD